MTNAAWVVSEHRSNMSERVREQVMLDSGRWPLFKRASVNALEAHSTKIEWLVEDGEDAVLPGNIRFYADYNYTQIFRTPFINRDSDGEYLRRHLDEIETALRSGVRHMYGSGVSTLGGVEDIIGRWPRKDDVLSLRYLRETEFRRYNLAGGSTQREYLTELSLLARKGRKD